MKALPDYAELQFVETVATGTVHVTYTIPVWQLPDPAPEHTSASGRSWAEVAMASDPALTVLCGRRTFPHLPMAEPTHRCTDRFADEQLCAACYRCLPEADRHRAFEHPQPGDPPEDD